MKPVESVQNWEEHDAKKIRFRQPFSEKYSLTINTDMLAGNFPIETKTEIRWAFRVIEADHSGQAEIELITVENRLVEANNPNLHDIAALSQAFGRMYSEIHVKLDSKGKVIKIINLPTILGKWEQTKAEMQKIESEIPAMTDVVKLNDDIFASPDKVKLAIESNEFFNIYFHLIYGEPLPAKKLRKTHRNLFNSADVDWEFVANSKRVMTPNGPFEVVKITGQPAEDLGQVWIKQAYGNFQMVDQTQIQPNLSESGEYVFHAETGKLRKAVLIKKEVAHPDFIRGDMTYTIKSEGELNDPIDLENLQPPDRSMEIPRPENWAEYW
ncbi:MAG: hypothetical protein WBD27_17415 [Pyrinomonadaceae bacterium]